MIKDEQIKLAEGVQPTIIKFINSVSRLNKKKDNVNKTIEYIHWLKNEIKASAYDFKYSQDDQEYDYERGFFKVSLVYWIERKNGKGYIESNMDIYLSWKDEFYWKYVLWNRDGDKIDKATSIDSTGKAYLRKYPTKVMLNNLIQLTFDKLKSSEKSIYDYRRYLTEIKELVIKLSYYSTYHDPLEVPKDELNGILKDLDSETFFDTSKKIEITDLINSILEVE